MRDALGMNYPGCAEILSGLRGVMLRCSKKTTDAGPGTQRPRSVAEVALVPVSQAFGACTIDIGEAGHIIIISSKGADRPGYRTEMFAQKWTSP